MAIQTWMQTLTRIQCKLIKLHDMKIIHKKLIGLALLLTMITACEKPEGALYSGEPNRVSFLSSTTNIVMGDGTLDVPVGRTSSEGELTIPVTLEASGAGYTNVFKISSPVTFADGESKTYVRIQVGDLSTVTPSAFAVTGAGLDVNAGLAFPMTIKIPEEHGSPTKVLSNAIQAQSLLSFSPIGQGTLDSEEGWWEETITPQIHKADGVNVYKVIEPFGFNNFVFMINADGTVSCPPQVIYMHSQYGPVTMRVSSGKVEGDWVVLNVSGYTVDAGSFGGGVERIRLPN